MSPHYKESRPNPLSNSSNGKRRQVDHDERSNGFQSHKRQKCDEMTSSSNEQPIREFIRNGPPRPNISFAAAVKLLPEPSPILSNVPGGYSPAEDARKNIKIDDELPALPPISNPRLAFAPFVHKSHLSASHSRSDASNDISYERLELLGDAYIELIASRLIFHRYPWLPAGRQSQLRELLVKNETLCGYSLWYGFHKKISLLDVESMKEGSKIRGNKGIVKIYGDVFEAYVAAVVLSDPVHGFAKTEEWLTALWAPKLLDAVNKDEANSVKSSVSSNVNSDAGMGSTGALDQAISFNPNGKAELQKRILGKDVRLDYEPYRDQIELKGDQLGQNRHFIALYLTGYGYERKELGRGEGKSKLEAGNWAAQQAMYGAAKVIVDECEKELIVKREEAKKRRAAENDKARIQSGEWDGRQSTSLVENAT